MGSSCGCWPRSTAAPMPGMLLMDGTVQVRRELTPHDGGTRLVFTETFPTTPADADRVSGGPAELAAWHLVLDRLEDTLDGQQPNLSTDGFDAHLDRKNGRPLTHPATVVEQEGRRWLVAPYGAVSWVHNARAAGRVTLGRRGDRRDYAVREVPAWETGPVLKRYVGVATATRPYFGADKDAPVEEFVAEADRHRVFELLPINEDRPNGDHGR
jgi:hypothetical protein